ncbi:MarR family winged helix-turn-helix transcriptional regulator [Pseudobacillus wudalianchiensis]|uniref:MarR family transcriptional regulator n=1 Tax=Pseudobacillus wudalianchiensis TaxID=1743143 RepID=A0A1B9B6K3_9BACI|nr:MarR family transcriptional regulator [Bacillus wudalianchiensis]OCA91727.1 MarR family transcriptional regulator [Bacillus wudalianchiensis]
MEHETIFDLLHTMDQVTNKLIIHWNKTFKENLGISHILVLSHLNEHGKSRPSDIAKALGLTPPSLTHLSEKLIQKKLAVRLADENDRRILYLDITDTGRSVLKKAHLEGQYLRRKLFEKLTAEERKQLLAIYEKLNS